MDKLSESRGWRTGGFLALFSVIVLYGLAIVLFVNGAQAGKAGDQTVAGEMIVAAVLVTLGTSLCMGGFFVVQPNEARVLTFVGRYAGTVREAGFWWTNPFTVKKHVSLRVRNFNSEKLKVNDSLGNPIEIAAVVVWRVVDSAKALFDVDNYETFVGIQSETAIRALATVHPYDAHEEGTPSLRGNPSAIAEDLRKEMQARLNLAGIEIMEARISHLAYAPEIAQAMLRRQQAHAVIAARQKIVEGAVGMVEMALRMLSDHQLVDLDEEKKAAMVNNLLVALVSEHEAQPVINTGTLYS
jgi:regulator of protease activity HflC (stomatin/prohibitin superfamily)